MEILTPISTQNSCSTHLSPHPSHSPAEFSTGADVVYALHGHYRISSIEVREFDHKSVKFYKLETQKRKHPRASANDHAIWIPVSSAKERGLRYPMTTKDVEEVFRILETKESLFELDESWLSIHERLETCIYAEGAIGLAKVYSYLCFLKRKQIVPPTVIARFLETVEKALLREISITLEQPLRIIEERIQKTLRQKSTSNN